MFDVTINVDGVIKGMNDLARDIRLADAAAVREVSQTIVIPAMKRAVSYSGKRAPIGQLGTRTGQLRNQIKLKPWIGKTDGLANGSVRVRGTRSHIARFNEEGTKSHGRYRGGGKIGQGHTRETLRRQSAGHSGLPARKMFATVGAAIRAQAEAGLVASFERNMKAKGYQ